ncbi:MAG: prolyl oligopeptidase family serine peptidase [Coprobacillus sp.]
MKKIIKLVLAFLIVGCTLIPTNVFASERESLTKESGSHGQYITRVEGRDWGPAVTKVILLRDNTDLTLNVNDYKVVSNRVFEDGTKIPGYDDTNSQVSEVYYSDDQGNKANSKSNYVTLELVIGPEVAQSSPFYFDQEAFKSSYVDMHMIVTHKSGAIFDKSVKNINVIADDFKTEAYEYKDDKFGDMKLSYGSYAPKEDDHKNALVIWLHGMGEGGTDPNLILYGNRVTNLATKETQEKFDGAYVLTPQAPTFWLNQGDGNMTVDGTSMYSDALMSLIKNYVDNNKDIDTERIYIGGCSNGGYMTMRMIVDNPDYFAAAYPICEALYDDYITDEDIQKIKHIPIWFTHSKDDVLIAPDDATTATYNRLKEAGAKNIHYSLFDNVVDTSGLYKKDGKPYPYFGHFSWIYTLNNECKLDYDGSPVVVDGKEVAIFDWLAMQKKQPMEYTEPTFMDNYGSIVISFIAVIAIVFICTRLPEHKEKV